MSTWLLILGIFGLLVNVATGNEVQLVRDAVPFALFPLNFYSKDGRNENRQRCSGMYSRKAWGGSVEPFILLKFVTDTEAGNTDPIVGLVIFEWKDEELIGRYKDAGDGSVGSTY